MLDEQILKRRKEEMTKKAIREGGFYGRNGTWNSLITFSGDKHLYRERVETIIVRDGKEVFVKKKPSGEYFLPGGSTEKDLSHEEQAINECKEEARINIKNIENTGITYKEHHEPPNWAKKESDIEWNGTYTEVYVAEYESMYKGKIDEVDKDPFILSGKFYSTKECFKFFRKEHREALLWFLKKLNEKNEEEVTESYISNYFKNKKLLKKISSSPDIEKGAVEQMISILKKEYSSLSAKSKIQRERKKEDVKNIFHPILTFDFSDGCTITIAICFDDSEFSDGVAINTESYGNMVVVYPKFFKAKKEDQIFVLLHEIGHIRLDHLSYRNTSKNIFGKDMYEENRIKRMQQGKCIYPEINADLYAVLNGASMYTILNSLYNKDMDDTYDYRLTNAELANRYTNVFKKYNNLRKYQEESKSFDSYDISCLAIYEMVYENVNIKDMSKKDKTRLYNLLYELCIHNVIKNDTYVKESDNKYLSIKKSGDSELIYEAYIDKITSHANAYNSIEPEKPSDIAPKNIHKKISNLINEKASYKRIFESSLSKVYEKMTLNHVLYESKNDNGGSDNKTYNLIKSYFD